MKHLLLLLLPAIVLCSCHTHKDGEEEAYAVTLKGDTVHIGEKSPVLSKIQTEVVKLTPYRMEFTTSGVVKAIPSNYAEIASPFAGRITKSFVRLGQKVIPGSPIFEISSPSFYETGKGYYQAKQEMELALKSLRREQDLIQNKVGVQKELEEAEVNYELKKKDYENALAALKVFQINPDELVLGQPLLVRSPIAGEVVTDRIVLGQYLKEDSDPIAVIANLDKVWVVAHVKEKDLGMILALDDVEIRLVAMPDKPFSGTIYHISEMLDEETRSVEVLIECDNSARLIKPAMYGTVKLSDKEAEVIRIPTSAILQEENQTYVLVSLGNNNYRKQTVVSGPTEDNKTVILSGLNPGDEVISTGAFYLLDAR
ncbi:efflux RND transporter periplasmic adaptor subunit [Parabacteroides bouchesdurhonensis]|uniref:efflux RND transporter periplasmic adaptor subunit n=1 Tax=Parabacteroides bouchesdurhonensis TaxID=1936995 RepID=UPI000E492CEF|nr:efflux RND transporter periplasmic adaptor subunit [Parabacteroides bouchesdurhonensis]RHJ92509.1 efflux RND transporter periplasmic adaptor subunit [Bacteroides sp. AM07-16]